MSAAILLKMNLVYNSTENEFREPLKNNRRTSRGTTARCVPDLRCPACPEGLTSRCRHTRIPSPYCSKKQQLKTVIFELLYSLFMLSEDVPVSVRRRKEHFTGLSDEADHQIRVRYGCTECLTPRCPHSSQGLWLTGHSHRTPPNPCSASRSPPRAPTVPDNTSRRSPGREGIPW